MKKAFIYKIQNTINGKLYIGSSTRPQKRWYEHKRDLNKSTHHSTHLQNSWNTYGEEMFEFVVIDECTIEQQFTLEKEWIIKEQTYLEEWGYNMAIPEEGGGYIHTEQQKQRKREIGKIKAIQQHQKAREEGKLEIRVYDLVTSEYEIYPATTDCPYKFKNNNKNFRIAKCKISTYDKTEEQIQKEFDKAVLQYKNYLKSQERKSGYNDRKRKVFKYEFLLWEDGILHTYDNLQDIAKHINVYPETVYTLSHKDYFVFNKYTVSKDNITDSAYKKVILEKKYSLTKGLMERVLRNEAKTHKGFSIKKKPVTLKIIINKELVYKSDLT